MTCLLNAIKGKTDHFPILCGGLFLEETQPQQGTRGVFLCKLIHLHCFITYVFEYIFCTLHCVDKIFSFSFIRHKQHLKTCTQSLSCKCLSYLALTAQSALHRLMSPCRTHSHTYGSVPTYSLFPRTVLPLLYTKLC